MSLYQEKINNKLIYCISNYEKINDNGNNKKKLSKYNKDLNNLLNLEKNKIDSYYNNNLWDKLKKFSNQYEFIYTTSYVNDYKNVADINPISRSFFKLWEILYDFKYIIPPDTKNLKTAHIAEGPGGFIECIYKYLIKNNIKSNNEIHGITLLSSDRNIPNWKIKKYIIDKFNIKLNKKNDCNGDLYKIESINEFINNVSLSSNITNCCDFVTADGGFDFSENYNTQENDFIIFLISEIYIIINILKEGGSAVIKIYDIYSRNSMKILYILTLFFEKVFIIKPLSSRPANSEKYILCESFIINDNILSKYKENFKNIIETKNLNLLDSIIPYKFIKVITDYNKFYTERQKLYIQNTLILIEKINNNEIFDTSIFLKELYNNNKMYAINWCKNYNIDIKI
jgi:23S rRNA U2552 (ribose-2'-O)-methylase RlmE/FtsJ|tara:strand:- start:958 stop:2154 length:1197 start_codon:yes stop_codon:yes gene_type:complete